MAHLPTIVSDLAMILLVAGITTILFKKLNQPLVLGYIIAGLITGPHFNFFPTVTDTANINAWSEIGVIFLLFALGLEFSFYKLKSVGSTAFVTTFVEIFGMLGVGYLTGHFLGWNHMDSLFLGGMLAMSSTTIIIKAFEDLNLKGQRFTEIVFGVLIVEDIAGIIMMVLLSTLAAASADISTLGLIESVLRLLFFLVLWFVIGMYLVPTFFKRAQNLMNDETLLVASVGLCLGMVVLAANMGFSSALGAFIMGSLIAEAPSAEKIEHLIKPVKDLFGAVFFVSVGMLVDLNLLLEYWLPIVVLVFVTIIGKLILSSGGVLLAGEDLNTSMHGGFSLAQIGEFSFIIASLGMSLGVISNFLYPIIVAVSVVTTFTTPFFIMAAEPAYQFARKTLPEKTLLWLNRYTDDTDDNTKDSVWLELLKEYFIRLLIFTTILLAIALGSQYYLQPYLTDKMPHYYANILSALLTIAVMAPFLRAILVNKTNHPERFYTLWFGKRSNHIPLMILLFIKIFVAASFIYFVFSQLIGMSFLFSIISTASAAYLISSSDWLMSEYLRIESRFLVNLNERHMIKHRKALAQAGQDSPYGWFDEELKLAHYKLENDSPLVNKTLLESAFRDLYGCNILQIVSKQAITDMPGRDHVLEKNSVLLIIGTDAQFKLFDTAISTQHLGLKRVADPVTMREFMLQEDKDTTNLSPFLSCAITISSGSPLLGKPLKDTDIRNEWNCMVIGLERGGYTMTNPNISLIFENGDLLWVFGKQKMINRLVREDIL